MVTSSKKRLASSIVRALRPLARLVVRCGLSYPEFENLTRSVFVEIVTKDFGKRNRPASVSRVSSILGLSRKEVSRIRELEDSESWFPESHMSPIGRVIHYWMHDPDYSDSNLEPRVLPLFGEGSFAALVRRYAGDVPMGAIRSELEGRGVVTVDESENCRLQTRFVVHSEQDDDQLKNILFSLRNLLETVEFNSRSEELGSPHRSQPQKRFERIVWSNRLTAREIDIFRAWLDVRGQEFLESANAKISSLEPAIDRSQPSRPAVGVGMYFYEQEPD